MASSAPSWEAGRTRLNSPYKHHDWDEHPQHHDHDRPEHQAGYVRVEGFPKLLHLLTLALDGSVAHVIERGRRCVSSSVGNRGSVQRAGARTRGFYVDGFTSPAWCCSRPGMS